MLGEKLLHNRRAPVISTEALLVVFFCLLPMPSLHSQDPHRNHAPADVNASERQTDRKDGADDAISPAKLLADKNESEFNHHLAGFLVAAAAIFIFFQPNLERRWLGAKYAWPVCFLISGLFLLVWSDTELWPFGPRQWMEALQNEREVLQHKTFAVLLLALGSVEMARSRGSLKAVWSAWCFPVVAIAGSILLMFHEHAGGMVGPNHMETMARIQSQHLSYTICGLGIGLMKGLSELKTRWSGVFLRTGPLGMIVLGILLMLYTE